MRKPYGSVLKRSFTELVANLDPTFVPFKTKSEYLFASNYPYILRTNEDIVLFLVLFLDPKGRERFTVEFGWSREGRFPEVHPIAPYQVGSKAECFEKREFLQTIGPSGGAEQWWWVEDEIEKSAYFRKYFSYPPVSTKQAQATVDRVLLDVKRMLSEHALPFLREFVEHNSSAGAR
jgi:hypothetical protein